DFGDRRGGLSGSLMRGKRSILLDLNDPRGLDLARRLAAVSDVVIDNFSARVMTNLGLDYDGLVQIRPEVICVRMTGVGLTGQERGIAITVVTDAEWEGFADAAGGPAWTRDTRFATRAGRVRHAAELDRQVAQWTRGQKAEEAMALFQRAGIAAGLVANAEDLCARDPQLAARRHFVEVPTPEGRTVRIDGPPFVLSETPGAVSGPGPLLGEHADEVLSGLLGI